MNSFTSSFKTEAKVIAVVLFVLIACELALRKFETTLSLDLKHIRAIPELASRLAESQKLRVLFVGNSFTRVSVDPTLFVSEMTSRGFGNLEVERVFPDGTRLNEWHLAFKTYFVEPKLTPDVLVIVTGRAHLHDRKMNPSTFGAYFSSRNDVLPYLGSPKHSINDKIEFLLARHLAICANRHRIEPRVFSRIIPNYQSCIQRINDERVRASTSPQRGKEPEFNRLKEFLTLGKQKGIPVIIATVPMSHSYRVDPKIPEIVAKHRMIFIEANEIEGLNASHFPDGYHIDQSGAEKYTRALAAKFAEVFESDPCFQKAR